MRRDTPSKTRAAAARKALQDKAKQSSDGFYKTVHDTEAMLDKLSDLRLGLFRDVFADEQAKSRMESEYRKRVASNVAMDEEGARQWKAKAKATYKANYLAHAKEKGGFNKKDLIFMLQNHVRQVPFRSAATDADLPPDIEDRLVALHGRLSGSVGAVAGLEASLLTTKRQAKETVGLLGRLQPNGEEAAAYRALMDKQPLDRASAARQASIEGKKTKLEARLVEARGALARARVEVERRESALKADRKQQWQQTQTLRGGESKYRGGGGGGGGVDALSSSLASVSLGSRGAISAHRRGTARGSGQGSPGGWGAAGPLPSSLGSTYRPQANRTRPRRKMGRAGSSSPALQRGGGGGGVGGTAPSSAAATAARARDAAAAAEVDRALESISEQSLRYRDRIATLEGKVRDVIDDTRVLGIAVDGGGGGVSANGLDWTIVVLHRDAGRQYRLRVDSDSFVLDLKKALFARTRIRVEQQHLLPANGGGSSLRDEQRIRGVGDLEDGAELILVVGREDTVGATRRRGQEGRAMGNALQDAGRDVDGGDGGAIARGKRSCWEDAESKGGGNGGVGELQGGLLVAARMAQREQRHEQMEAWLRRTQQAAAAGRGGGGVGGEKRAKRREA